MREVENLDALAITWRAKNRTAISAGGGQRRNGSHYVFEMLPGFHFRKIACRRRSDLGALALPPELSGAGRLGKEGA